MTDHTIIWPGHVAQAAENGAMTTVAHPEGREVLRAFGDEITVLLGGAETGGKYSACLDVTPPGQGPPPHYHLNEDEWFFPLEGRVAFFLDGAWQEVPAGSMVFIPRGTVHTFQNRGETPLRMLIHTAPAGFEVFFKRCAEVFAEAGPPDMARIVAIGAEHGIHFITD